jgi:ribonucleotide monophosphatase NagD (HAD superfamily)
VPFLLLTNGGGHHDKDRVEKLSEKLKIPLDTDMFIQSHTPFADMERFKDKTIMVIGGEGDNCRQVAEKSDLITSQLLAGTT